jgi:FixJ family two-component response regulator
MSVPPSMVYVVDDDEASLKATARLLKACGFDVKTFLSAEDLIEAEEIGTAGCIVSDLQMPGMSGLDLQGALSERGCRLPIVFLTGHADIPSSVTAMRGGAEDFIEKVAPPDVLIDAVRRALEHNALDLAGQARLEAMQARFAALTPREREVLLMVVHGRLNKQIAGDLGIHERTVKLHRTAITTKLGVHSVAGLTSLCHEAGLLQPGDSTCPKG